MFAVSAQHVNAAITKPKFAGFGLVEKTPPRLERLYAFAERERERRRKCGAYRPTYRRIEQRIMRAMRVREVDLRSRRRAPLIVLARQAITYWACRQTYLSLPDIGRRLGGFDHTTCINSRNTYPVKRAKMGRFLRPLR